MIKPIILLTIAILTVPTAYAQLDSDSTQYNFDNAKFEFADDLGNSVDLKFDKKGQLKLFDIVLYDYNYNDSNLQFSRFETNKTDGSFSAFAFSNNSVIFLDFKTNNSTFFLDLYYNKADRTPTKLHFTGSDTKQFPVQAKNDIAILLIVETAKILKTIQDLQIDHVTIPMSQLNPLISEVIQTESDSDYAIQKMKRFLFLRNIFQYNGNFTDVKIAVNDMRESHSVALKSFKLSESHHEIFLSKINEKKIGPLHWEEFDKHQRLEEIYEKSLAVEIKFKKFIHDFRFANDTEHIIAYVERNGYKTPAEVSDFKKWLERR